MLAGSSGRTVPCVRVHAGGQHLLDPLADLIEIGRSRTTVLSADEVVTGLVLGYREHRSRRAVARNGQHEDGRSRIGELVADDTGELSG